MRQRLRRRAWVLAMTATLGISACGGATAEGSAHAVTPVSEPPSTEPAPEPVAKPATPDVTTPAAPPDTGPPAPPGTPDVPPPPDDSALPMATAVQGAEIPRGALLAVLSGGVGRFLQKVRAEPHLVNGRFIGWRLIQLFQPDPSRPPSPTLQLGDTVLRVNGQSIERPEQFKNVWDSLATASELILDIQRNGQTSTIHYRIVD